MNKLKILIKCFLIMVIVFMICIILYYNKKNEDYIISITTIPSRINLIEPIIKSYLNQNIGRPEKIIINIPKKYNRFPNQQIKIPDFFNNYKEIFVNKINYDYGPATKVLGLNYLKINPNTIILVSDDDNIKKKTGQKY